VLSSFLAPLATLLRAHWSTSHHMIWAAKCSSYINSITGYCGIRRSQSSITRQKFPSAMHKTHQRVRSHMNPLPTSTGDFQESRYAKAVW
jgi:hypothetical protein